MHYRYGDYIKFLKKYGTADTEKTVVEIHHDDSTHPSSAPVRSAHMLPEFDLQKSFIDNAMPSW